MESGGRNSLPPIGKMSNDDLRRYGIDNLIRMLRDVDNARLEVLREHGNLMKSVNQRMQTHLMEVRSLKDVNQKLQDENQEVRDLACFLDDDRQKGRKLAKEWQRFGRYTSGVMKSELSAYQVKLQELEEKQEGLMKENLELKELCLYLDDEVKQCRRDSIDRDDGDGSSSSSPSGEKLDDVQAPTGLVQQYNNRDQVPIQTINEQTLQYIKKLEQQIHHMEHQREPFPTSASAEPHKYFSSPHLAPEHHIIGQRRREAASLSGGRPESVMKAMRVLEIHERLEQERIMDHRQQQREDVQDVTMLDEAERAIVKQLCNVVWKKLGDA